MLVELENRELIVINGGHQGAAYNAGHAVGEFVTKTFLVIAVVGFFMGS